MRKRILFHLYCLLFLCSALTTVNAQQVFKTTTSTVIGYLEYLPQGYNNNSDKYPIVIFLHGIGERGVNSTDPNTLSTTIQRVAKLGPPRHVKNGAQFPFILISPQLKSNYGTWSSWHVMEVINHVKTYLRVDEKRIYLTGLSLGGGGTWVTAQDNPALFAAIAPVCGGYNSTSKACRLATENLPVWAFHGDKDTVVPLSRSVNMVNAINNCNPKPSPFSKMTIYPGVAHNAWTKAYSNDHTIHNPNVYDWLTSHTNLYNNGNKIPVANAGNDISVSSSSSVVINGSGSDADGSISSYTWSQLNGPSGASLSNKASKTLTASNLKAGSYMFSLTVKDNNGNTDSDYVKVTVSGSASNTTPIADAGSDKTIILPANSVSVTGSASDTDGTIASYAWSKVSGGTASLSGTTSATLKATNLVEGPYVFRFTVTDNKGAKKSDDMTVSVKTGTTGNMAPVASAGSDKIVTLPANAIKLTGGGTDADGTIAYYKWKKVSGPSCYYYGVSRQTLELSRMDAGTYSFGLTVTDNKGATGTDQITVTVKDGSSGSTGDDIADTTPPSDGSNQNPVANAGADKVLTLPANAINLTGNGTDADGTITYYKWKKVSGPSCYYYGVSRQTLELSRMDAGTYSFSLTVTDNKGATGTDQITVTVKDGSSGSAGDDIADTTPPSDGANQNPVADAGADRVLTLPSDALDLTGSGADADGTIAYHKWKKVSGPSCYYYGVSRFTLELADMDAGTYVFRFTVTDNDGATDTDEVKVTVKDGVASTRSYMTEQVNIAESEIAEVNGLMTSPVNETPVLGRMKQGQLENSTVVIFDDAGEEIYSGQWNSETSKSVLTKSGLYIYNVIRDGRRMDAGKIFIRG